VSEATPLLRVTDLRVGYGNVVAVDGVSFELFPGEILGLAGESGSGKSTIAHAIARTLPAPAVIRGGAVELLGRDLLRCSYAEMQAVRWRDLALVFQSAMNALNPILTVAAQLADTIVAHETVTREQAWQRGVELLDLVGVARQHMNSYPHQLSGGMRQRVVLGMALALRPKLLVLDEATTALDVITQKQILDRVMQLKAELGFAVLFISHDLSVLFDYADRLLVLYAGRVAEQGRCPELQQQPFHPYTAGLMASFPALHGPLLPLRGIPGAPPIATEMPSGCRFHPRCPRAAVECAAQTPALTRADNQRQVACFFPLS
jgi:peptide/nickel transport system ATP-binding protein